MSIKESIFIIATTDILASVGFLIGWFLMKKTTREILKDE